MAQVLAFNLRQIGIDLEVKYFDAAALREKVATRGEPFDLVTCGWGADYADGAAFFVPLLDGRPRATGNLNFSYFDDPRSTPGSRRRTGSRARRDARPGPTSTST